MNGFSPHKTMTIAARFIGVSACLSITACATQFHPANRISDEPYQGIVDSGGIDRTVITKFREEQGTIVGDYSFKDKNVVTGTIDDCKIESHWSMLCAWHDKYGSGNLRMLFGFEGRTFTGFWGRKDDDSPSMTWTGSQTNNPQLPD